MDELGMVFKGSLPAYEVDETKVQQGDIRAGMQDCLAEQEQVKALAFRFEKYLCRMLAPVSRRHTQGSILKIPVVYAIALMFFTIKADGQGAAAANGRCLMTEP